MCVLMQHYYACTCPFPTTLPQPDCSPVQPDTDRQPCAKYMLDIPCEPQIVPVTLITRCPSCEAFEHSLARRATGVWDRVAEQVSTTNITAAVKSEAKKQERYSTVAPNHRQGKVREQKGVGYWAQDDEDEQRKEKKWLKQFSSHFV